MAVSSTSASPIVSTTATPASVEGTFTVAVSRAEAAAVGVPNHEIGENWGDYTLTLDDGTWTWHQVKVPKPRWPDWTGTYAISGDRITFVSTSPPVFAGQVAEASFAAAPDGITFTVVSTTPQDLLPYYRSMLGADKRWTRTA